ncbi:hypothetical protein VP1G_10662 [Cytospora mali]|uniref:Uncharacterized protein n=1 Tax=Cytospora mali TaxID=578113 RepID=A0A194US27_CYTMA|nr:hypothetical protein VP1G_10662 [Valsa mali var. pyri (nom. inval.)]
MDAHWLTEDHTNTSQPPIEFAELLRPHTLQLTLDTKQLDLAVRLLLRPPLQELLDPLKRLLIILHQNRNSIKPTRTRDHTTKHPLNPSQRINKLRLRLWLYGDATLIPHPAHQLPSRFKRPRKLLHLPARQHPSELLIPSLQIIPELPRPSRVNSLDHADGLGPTLDIDHAHGHAPRQRHLVLLDLGVPAPPVDDLLQLGAEAGLARQGHGVQDGRAEAPVQTGAVDGGGDVEPGPDLALGAAVRRLREVVEDRPALVRVEVAVAGRELGDRDTTVFRGQMVAIPPCAANKLGALDDNLGQLDALGGWDPPGDDVDAGVEAEDESRVVPVGDEVPAGEEDLSRGGDGCRGVLGRGGHVWNTEGEIPG